MFEIKDTKSAYKTAYIGTKALHSTINPYLEAKKFLDKSLKKTPKTLIILFPCLNYIGLYAHEKYKDIKIISIYSDVFFQKNSIFNQIYLLKENIKDLFFLLQDEDLIDLQIITWYLHKDINIYIDKIKNIISLKNASCISKSYFSFLYFKNTIKNYLIDFDFISLPKTSGNHLLLSSGTSLEDHIEFLQKNQNDLVISAMPSSIVALNYYGIKYDFVFSVDAGYYAGEHLKNIKGNPIIIASMNAYLPKECKKFLVSPLFLEDFVGVYFSNLFCNNNLKIKEHGSVSILALSIINKMHSGDIFLLGQDFCLNDVQSHIQPHTFDIFDQDRIKSKMSLLYEKFFLQDPKRIKDRYYFGFQLKKYYDYFISYTKELNLKNVFLLQKSILDIPFEVKNISYKKKKIEFCKLKKSKKEYEKIIQFIDNLKENITNDKFENDKFFKNIFFSEYLNYKKNSEFDKNKVIQKLDKLIKIINYKI